MLLSGHFTTLLVYDIRTNIRSANNLLQSRFSCRNLIQLPGVKVRSRIQRCGAARQKQRAALRGAARRRIRCERSLTAKNK